MSVSIQEYIVTSLPNRLNTIRLHTQIQQCSPKIVGCVRKEPCSIGHQTIGTELWNSTLICGSGNSGQCGNGMRAQHIMVQTNHFIWTDFELFIDQYCMHQASKKFGTLFCCFMLISLGMTKICKKILVFLWSAGEIAGGLPA